MTDPQIADDAMAEENRSPDEARQQIYHVAQTLFDRTTDWVTFFREVLGPEGAVQQNCPEQHSREQFEQTAEYAEIQEMLVKLRKKNNLPTSHSEKSRMITIRLPESLHRSLTDEAHEKRTSVNKLAISKLMQPIDSKKVLR